MSTCLNPVCPLLVAVACVGIAGCMAGPSTGVVPSHASYAKFYLTTQDGKTFNSLTIDKWSLPRETFKVRFPSGEEVFLEELTLDSIAQNEFFERQNAFFDGVGMDVWLEEGRLSYFMFGLTYMGASNGGKPAVTLTYVPANKAVTFPLSREEMEATFGKDYKLDI